MARHSLSGALLMLLTSVLAISLAGCGGGGGGGGAAANVIPIIQPNVVTLPSDGSVTVSSVTSSTVTLTGSVPNILAGDILVSSTGQGFLRKVTSAQASNGVVTVQTTDAGLPDVFQQAHIAVNQTLQPSDYATVTTSTTGISFSTAAAPSVKGSRVPHTGLAEVVNFNNVQIKSGNAEITLNGTAAFSLNLAIAIDIDNQGVRSNQLIPTITGTSNVTVHSAGAGTLPVITLPIGQLVGKPIVTTVGGIPITFTPTVNLSTTAFGQIQVGVDFTSSGGYSESQAGVSNSISATPTISSYTTAAFAVTPVHSNVVVAIDGAAGLTEDADCPRYVVQLTGQTSPVSAAVTVVADFDGQTVPGSQIFGLPVSDPLPFDWKFTLVNQTFTSGSGGPPAIGAPVAVLGRVIASGGLFPVPGTVPLGLDGAAANYVPVAIQISATPGNIDRTLLVEYHVYRPDVTSLPGEPTGFGDVPIYAFATKSNLVFYDDGSTKTFQASKPDPNNLAALLTYSDASSPAPETAIPETLIGQRFAYSVEALWTQPTTGGNFDYELTPAVQTNYVTYLQPVDLTPTDFTGTDAHHLQLTIPATITADDYVLQVSGSSSFATVKTYTPYSPSLIQTQSATQSNPREGSTFQFFNPATDWDAASDFPGVTELFARVGVRDSRNGTDSSTNPYLFSDAVGIPQNLL